MSKYIVPKFTFLFFTAFLFTGLSLHAQSRSEHYKMFTDVLDELGGRASSANYLLRIGTSGQPSMVGLSKENSLWARQGYVNTAAFVHGDDNADGRITVSDVVYEINHLFKGGPPSLPPEVCDVNCDNQCNVTDVVYKINYLFKGGPPPCNL